MGPTIRHGPHHGAQRSTMTAGAALASTSKVLSVALTSHGRTLPQLPQCGAPRSLGRIRLLLPQLVHTSVETGPVAGFGGAGSGLGEASVIEFRLRGYA
jgi:hypothetical protein